MDKKPELGEEVSEGVLLVTVAVALAPPQQVPRQRWVSSSEMISWRTHLLKEQNSQDHLPAHGALAAQWRESTPYPLDSHFHLIRKSVAATRVFLIVQFGKSNRSKMERRPGTGNTMPNDSHQRAAEYHELAAHAHRAAAAHHGKEDHQTGHEHSKQALEHANKAFQWSQEAHRKSLKSAQKP